MEYISKLKKVLHLILVFWIPVNMLLILMYFVFIVDLPISEKKVIFLNNMLKEIENTYNNQCDNKTFYEDSAFEIISSDKYSHFNSKANYLCKFTSKAVIRLKVSVGNHILYRDTIDKCCYGYYDVTYNYSDNTALCIYRENEGVINIDLSRTKVTKTLK